MKNFGKWKIMILIITAGLVIGAAYWWWGNGPGLNSATLATVNNTKITKQDFDEQWKRLPQEEQHSFKEDQEGFLENLILTELLYQEAQQRGIAATDGNVATSKQQAIFAMLQRVADQVIVTDAEARQFYDENPLRVKGMKFEDIQVDIKGYLLSQKQDETINQFIETIKAKSTVSRNQSWLKEQRKIASSENPFSKVVHNGKPTVLDLGSNSCVPCKMMKPILDELEQEYKNKANIIVLDISNYQDLARQYRVRVIPTQIFFDQNGKEYWRHEGFLDKEKIQEKLNGVGVE